MKHQLPALALRTTRVRLLASTYEDALLAWSQGNGYGEAGSRMNLHDDLWTAGSYAELDLVMGSMNGRRRDFSRAYLAVAFKHQPLHQLEVLQYVADGMPRNIYVPAEVSENAGYLASEAGVYEMPDAERHRRWARKPVRPMRAAS